MPVERRGQAIHATIVWSTGNRRNCLVVAGSAQFSLNDKSRVSREAQARFREGLGVQLPGATRLPAESRAAGEYVNVAGLTSLGAQRKLRPASQKMVGHDGNQETGNFDSTNLTPC